MKTTEFMAGYDTYKKGTKRGSVRQWREAFSKTMGIPKRSFQAGVRVRLIKRVRAGFQTATILKRDDAFAAGAVYLDRPLDGCRWWNVEDLRAVR